MNFAIALSIRDKATRLPNKSWVDLNGIPLILFMIERLKSTNIPVYLATSTEMGDDKIASISGSGFGIFRGDPEDKLKRYLDLCIAESLDFVIVVDGDDPLIDVNKIFQVAEIMANSEVNLVSFDKFALGISTTGISKSLLTSAVANKTQKDTEVWLSFIRTLSDVNEHTFHNKENLDQQEIRLTLDYPEDLLLIEICLALTDGTCLIPTDRILTLFEKVPKLCEINSWRSFEYNYIINNKSEIA